MVTQVALYDVLVKGAILYPLGVTLGFWEGIIYYRLGWQTIDSCKDFLSFTFVKGHVRKSNNSTLLIGFLELPHGFDLLEGNVHVMDNPPTHEMDILSA